jgi:DNA-damage-inducible protein D
MFSPLGGEGKVTGMKRSSFGSGDPCDDGGRPVIISHLDYAVFQDHGYRGLYGGKTMRDIHGLKGLKKSQKILDHMGSTELAANLFRATQAEDKLKRDGARTKARANDIHHAVGRKVRETIAELGGVMPEHLPTPETSIKQLERARAKAVKGPTGEGI